MGAAFAAPSLGSTEPSKILYKPHESWTTLSDWEATLPSGENATLIAVGGIAPVYGEDEVSGLTGSGAVLVATDRGFVRFFSGAGLQKYVWNIGEEIVTMAGGKDWAMIVHRSNGAGAGLDFALIDTDSFEVVQAGKVPLAKGTTLRWLGFTDENVNRIFTNLLLLELTLTFSLSRRFPPCVIQKVSGLSWIDRVALVKVDGYLRSTRRVSQDAKASKRITGPLASTRKRPTFSSSK